MAPRRKRRTHTEHPGVKLLPIQRLTGIAWVARFTDPDTHHVIQISLTALGLTTDQSRRAWAIQKSQSLRSRKAAIQSGAPLRTETPVAKALTDYYESQSSELAPATLLSYKQATEPFAAWCNNYGVTLAESLTAQLLAKYRLWFVARPAHAPVAGRNAGRGRYKVGSHKRSPAQINKCIRTLRVVLNHWRKLGLTPALDSDAIRDSLEFAKAQRELPHFLKTPQCRTLLESATRHDADRFALTRQEHDGKGTPGTTARYTPIAPFVAVGLLSGMRFTELANLRWRDVDLEAGEITLDADRTKTGHARRITLAETPALAALLAAMTLRAGEDQFVWGKEAYRRNVAESARKRLVKEYGAPEFSWQDLRRTCGTFLTCAPSIYGAASAFLSAKRLGHSVAVAEKYYVGAVTVAPEIKTLEAALKIDDLCAKIIASLSGTVAQGRLLKLSA